MAPNFSVIKRSGKKWQIDNIWSV